MRRFVLPASLLLAASMSSPAFAAAVSAWGPGEGITATGVSAGTHLLDVRCSAVNNGLINGQSALSATPALAMVWGVSDTLEFGLGSALTFSALGSSTNTASLLGVYPWVHLGLPWGDDRLKTGLAMGAQVAGLHSASQISLGATALVDLVTGPLTTSVNLGLSQGLSSSPLTPSALLGFTLPLGALSWYEEQFIHSAGTSGSDGGFRLAVTYPLSDTLTCDVAPALLWSSTPDGTAWRFQPNLGVTWSF